jgi:hypothetical protein
MTERIVADRVRGVQRFAQIRVIDRQRRRARVAPHAGEAIGLQLDAHRGLVLVLALNLRCVAPIKFCTW